MLRALVAKLRKIVGNVPTSDRRAAIEGWSLFMGRDAAELWLDALAHRDASRLSNA